MRTVAFAQRAVVVLLALLCASLATVSAQPIPPGRRAVIASMLGSGEPLPGRCAFADGQIDHDVVRATYRCADGDVGVTLSPRVATTAPTIATERFALTVTGGSPPDGLLAAIVARIRAHEADLGPNGHAAGTMSRGGASVSGVARGTFALALLVLAGASATGARRDWTTGAPLDRRALLEALVVTVVVAVWLQAGAAPPAHRDTAVDVALARDCLASGGTTCLGHTASAIGLAQGQAFTYGLAAWLRAGWSMRALCVFAACGVAAATGLLHSVVARRFGAAAWVVSAAAASLAVAMTGYPTIWNPSWFVLPLTLAFVATLALARGCGIWSAWVAGVAFALTAESHLLFGAFVAVAAVIAGLTSRTPLAAASMLIGSFVLAEVVTSPESTAQNVLILRGWVAQHLGPTSALALLFCASVPIQMRLRAAIRDRLATRESVTVVVWMIAGAAGLGLVLPWAVSRPPQIRYYGAAFPALGFALGWLLDAPSRQRPHAARIVAVAFFALVFGYRLTSGRDGGTGWRMDDVAEVVGRTAGFAGVSALDLQLGVRPMPVGAFGPVAAAFAGTADSPSFPTRIVRVVLPQHAVAPLAGWSRIDLGGRAILTSSIDAWTHPTDAEVCADPANGEPCLTLTRDDFLAVGRAAGGELHRVFGLRIGRSAERIAGWTARGAHALLWKIPLRADGSDGAREIVFPVDSDERIVAVAGTRWSARNDHHVVVERPTPGAVASITVGTTITDTFEAGLPPMPFELRKDELAVLRETTPAAAHDPHGVEPPL